MRVAELEGLQFQISANSDDASKHLNSLASSLKAVKEAASRISVLNKAASAVKEIADASSKGDGDNLTKLANALTSLGSTKISSTIAKNLASIVDAVNSVSESSVSRLERMASALSGIGNIGKINVPKLNLPEQQIQNRGDLENIKTSSGSTTEQSLRDVGKAMDDVSTRSAPNFRAVLGSIVGSLRKLATGSDLASRGLRGIAKYTVGLPITLGSGFAKRIGEATSSLGHMFSAIKRIALYRLIRAVIREITQGLKEGIQNIYAYSRALSGEFAAAMDSLATSSLYLKNSLGAMAAPIIQSLIPAINWAIDRIVALMNVINMFVAALGGKATTTVAKRVETVFNAAGSAAGGAAGAAKKALDDLKTFTIGIDELNIIDPKDKSGSGSGGGGGGGGAGALDPSSMFEEVDINKGISDFATKLKDAIKAQKWDQVGKILGDKFNEVVGDIKWKDIGANIGSKLGAAITISYNFLKTADTYTLGQKVADFLNSAIERVNTDDLGRLLVSRVTKGIDFLIGFSLNVNMREVAQKINDFLKGAFNEAREWLGGRDWYETGSKLRQQITEFIKGIDWEGIWNDLIAFLKSLGHSVNELIAGLLGVEGFKLFDWLGASFTPDVIPPSMREQLSPKSIGVTPITIKPVVQNDSKQWKSDLNRYWEKGVNNSPVAPFATNLQNDSTKWLTDRNTWWTLKNNRNPVAPFVTNLKDESNKWITTRNTAWNSKNGTPVAPFTTNVKKEGAKWRTDVENEWGQNKPTLPISVGVTNASTLWSVVEKAWNATKGVLKTQVQFIAPTVTLDWKPSGGSYYNLGKTGSSVGQLKFNTSWGAEGMILKGAQIFGKLGDKLLGGGEAGAEALLPLDRNTGWMDTIAEKVRDTMATAANYEYSGMDRILSRLDAIEAMLGSVDDNTRIQAEKPSNTYVSIGGRAVRDAVVRQTNADGYSFA